MRDYFTFGGKDSRDFDLYIARAAQFDSPRRDVEVVTIPGRNGTLSIDNGRFENMIHKYEVYTSGRITDNLHAMRAWLNNSSGYRVLKDTLHPDEFYMARFVDEINIEKSDRVGAKFTLVFDRKPQRFIESGNIPLAPFTTGGRIYNKYQYPAAPLIRAYGAGTFRIGDIGVTITGADVYTDIDSDLQEAYKGDLSVSKNSFIKLENGKFPVLPPGSTTVSVTGITSLIITPRWWTI